MLQAVSINMNNRTSGANRSAISMAYWIIITIIFLYDRSYLIVKAGLPYFIVCSIVRIALLIGITYANINWLIPHYLLRKKYYSYFGLVLALLVGYIILQSLFDHLLYGYILSPFRRSDLYVSLLYNFTHTSWYLLLTVALKLSIDWHDQRQTLHALEVEKLETQVNYLRSQINPHFLFNALNNLYALTLKKSDQAPHVVLKLSGMMEYMLYESNETYVPLEKEIWYLENYLDLEKLRQGNHAAISMEITGHPGGYDIAPFILLPLVENAFKHGVGKSINNAYLHIRIAIENRTFTFSVENNKQSQPDPAHPGGIGLSNLEKRLQLLYPGRYSLQIDNLENRYRVLLKLYY